MGGLEMCTSCMNRGQDGNNLYAYEAYRKMPFFGSLSNYLRLIKGGDGQSMGFLSNISSFIGDGGSGGGIGGKLSGLIGSFTGGQQGPGPSMPVNPQQIFKKLNIARLMPIDSGSSATSIFDMAGDQTFVRKIKKSNYAQQAKSIQGTNQLFTDSEFPPNSTSLGNLQSHGVDPSAVKWKRIREILKDPVLVQDKVQPADILQGQLGDCYFLSALSAIAQQQFRIKSLFPSLQINKNGIYMARILHDGEYMQVVVDDFFPVDRNGKVLFAQPAAQREIWVMILQKCWAKLYGSYEAIIGGLPNEVLHAFCSAPVYFHRIPETYERQQALWNRMIESDKQGGLLACGTKSDGSIQEYGFVKGHAYTILGVYDKPVRLLKLRNPWGHKEWKGRASDYDLDFWNSVNATDKQFLDYQDASRKQEKDGIFFLTWEDFIRYFQLVDICKINDNANYNFIRSDFQHLSPKLYQFEIKGGEPSLVTIAITQPNKRGSQLRCYSRNFAALGRWDENSKTYKYVTSKSNKNFPDNFIEVSKATEGKYILYSKYYLSEGRRKGPGVVSIYSPSPATVTENKDINCEQFLSQIFYDHASRNPRRKQVNNSNDWVCSDILLNQGGFSYFVASLDPSSKNKLGVSFQEKEYEEKRLVLQPPFKGKQKVDETVTAEKPLVVIAELLTQNFPGSIVNPNPKVVPLPQNSYHLDNLLY